MYGLFALMPQKKWWFMLFDGSHVLGTINHEMSFMKGFTKISDKL